MTGIGTGEASVAPAPDCADGGARVVCEIRSTNHRYVDVRVRAGAGLGDLVPVVEQLARERLSRGRYDVTVAMHGSVSRGVDLDVARARAAFAALGALRDELSPGAEIPMSLLSAVPDLFSARAGACSEALKEALALAFGRAADDLVAMRDREGAALAADFSACVDALVRHLDAVQERAAGLPEIHARRLRDRVARLAQSAEVALDPARVEQEVVLIADRVDVAEEIVRARSHVDQLKSVLSADNGAGGKGKKVEFLLQELARETNTIGAKGQDAEIARLVVEMKCEIEKMREQAQNVE